MIRMNTGEIITFDEFKRRSNTSFPDGVVTGSFVEEKGGQVILEGPQPTGEFWQYTFRDGVEQVNGKWFWKYSLGPVFKSDGEKESYISQKEKELHRGHEISVNEERTRRIIAGNTFTVNGKDIFLTGEKENKDNLSDLAFAASMRMSQGDFSHVTVFRDGNNKDHELSPQEILQLWSVATSYVSNLYQKSWDLKAKDPIPDDYTDDKYWS